MVSNRALLLAGIASFTLGLVLRTQMGSVEPDLACPPARPPSPLSSSSSSSSSSISSTPKPKVEDLSSQVDKEKEAREASVVASVGGSWNDENDVVMGLARTESEWRTEFRMFVGTLRHTGYKGRIVLHVHPQLASETPPRHLKATRAYLLERKVELVPVRTAPCEFSFKPTFVHAEIRKMCTEEYPKLQLEWARFAMARDWVKQNPQTGWVLVTDVRDTFFQRPPFSDLGAPIGDSSFVFEEYYGDPDKTIATGKVQGIDCSHWFAKMASKCYGEEAWKRYSTKPMLCSGQILGTGPGIVKMLDQYLAEMKRNGIKGPSCVPPELPDQTLLNYMVYNKELDTSTVPYGDGPVLTIGGVCTSNTGKKGLREKLDFDSEKFILDAKKRRAAVVHQWDRCGDWMERWLRHHLSSFNELELSGRWVSKEPELDTVAPLKTVTKNGEVWVDCAAENGECSCGTQVRFGSKAADKWTTLTVDGPKRGVACLNEQVGGLFSDPAIGLPKMCQCKE